MDRLDRILHLIETLNYAITGLNKRLDRLEGKSITSPPERQLEIPCYPPSGKPFGYGKSTSYSEIESKRRAVIKALGIIHNVTLTRSTKTLFSHDERRYCFSISRLGEKRFRPYLYSYCPEWHEYLSLGEEGYFVLGMMDRAEAYAIPVHCMETILPFLSETTRKGQRKWNVTLAIQQGGSLAIQLPDPPGAMDLSPFRFSI